MKEDQETGVLSRLIGGFGPMFIICSKHCGTVMIHGDVCALQVAQVMELLKPGGCWESSKNLQVHCSSMLPQPCSNYPNRRQQNFFFFPKDYTDIHQVLDMQTVSVATADDLPDQPVATSQHCDKQLENFQVNRFKSVMLLMLNS